MSKRQRDVTQDDNESVENIKRTRTMGKERKLPKIVDGTYFKVDEWNENVVNFRAMCMKCEKYYKGQYSSTGNFYKHYRAVHPDFFDEMRNYCDIKLEKEQATSKTNLKQPTISCINRLDPIKVKPHGLFFFAI